MVISLGEALIDFISRKDLEFAGFPGGSPFNTSVALSRLGVPVQFLGRVSTDMFGQQLMDYLTANGVGTEITLRAEAPTTLSFVKKQPDGQARYAFFSNGASDKSWPREEMDRVIIPEKARMIHFGSISFSQEPCGSTLENFLKTRCGKLLLSFDPNIRPSLVPDREVYMDRFHALCPLSTVIKLSDEDLEWLYPETSREEALDSLLERGVTLIALTEGKKGARLITKQHNVTTPLYDLPVADTIGAGDTFHGAILAYFHDRQWFDRETIAALNAEQLKDLGEYANKAAGINCSRSGANPPTTAEMTKDWFAQ
ncbi:MAG: carbohydrate kinase [Spirochaetales bacterium]|nr:carbohydrate kinase [Spirochaetales bacterium]